jgi:peptide/nickel transport system substrate-binding protein/oligopeptide transport system substrate-binding protein
VRLTPDADVVPALATSWDVSDDGTVYTFRLRSGVRFHDGTQFVAHHVVRSFERVLDPAERGGRGWPLHPIRGAREFESQAAANIAGLSAPDDSTVVIQLTEPLAIFIKLLAMPVAAIVPDSTPADFGEHPIGTGPWKLVRWEHDDYLLFARNEEYFAGPPAAESLLARIIPEPSTAVAEFDAGNVDILYIPEAETRQWEETDERRGRLQSAPGLRLWYAGINTTRGALRDARVRRAINHAVDVQTILDQLIGGRGTVANGVIPPALEGADSARATYAYDPARARALLAEAGHSDGIDIELWSSTTPPFPRVAEAIQAYLGEAGIRAQLVQREAAAVREAARNGQTDMIVKDWFADYPDAENFLYPLLHSANHGVGGNVSFYTNAAYDQLVARARRELTDSTRVALYRQADSLAFADAPMLYLFHYRELFAIQPWISGFEVPVVFNGQDFREVKIGG